MVGWHQNGQKSMEGGLVASKGKDELFENPPLKHGTWKSWKEDGKILAEGVWKNGKPWDGICFVPLSGDAGSAMGLEQFNRYRWGVLIEEKVIKR